MSELFGTKANGSSVIFSVKSVDKSEDVLPAPTAPSTSTPEVNAGGSEVSSSTWTPSGSEPNDTLEVPAGESGGDGSSGSDVDALIAEYEAQLSELRNQVGESQELYAQILADMIEQQQAYYSRNAARLSAEGFSSTILTGSLGESSSDASIRRRTLLGG